MKKTLLSLCALVLSSQVVAAEVLCPKRIETKQSLLKKISSWEPFFDPNAVNILRSVDFYDGNPKEMANLVPDGPVAGQDPVWTFATSQNGTAREIWMVCRYQDSQVSLTKKLSREIKACKVQYSKKVSPQIDSINCE